MGALRHFRPGGRSPLEPGGLPLVQRHRLVYQLLEQERADGVHALAMRTLTPAEYGLDPSPGESPACVGGHD